MSCASMLFVAAFTRISAKFSVVMFFGNIRGILGSISVEFDVGQRNFWEHLVVLGFQPKTDQLTSSLVDANNG